MLSWQLLFIVAGNKEPLSTGDVSHAWSSSQRRVITGAEFVEKLKQLIQRLPNGLPVAMLACHYKVIYCSLLLVMLLVTMSLIWEQKAVLLQRKLMAL